jgi:hypothetical protein
MAQQKIKEPPTTDAATDGPIKLSVDAIIKVGGFVGSKLFRAGEPTPYASAEDVSPNLKPFIADPSQDLEEPSEPERFANYELNTIYSMHSDGARGRALRRQVQELAHAASEQEWAEAEAERANALDEETAKVLQDAHDAHVGLQLKALEIRARDADAAVELANRQENDDVIQDQSVDRRLDLICDQEQRPEPHGGPKRKGKQK